MDLFLENFASLASLQQIYPLLLQGLELTVLLALVTLPLSIATGLAVAIVYSFGGSLVRRITIILIDLLRSFPVIVLLILIFYSLPFFGIKLGNFTAVVVALVINNTGYFGEIFRAGLLSIPKGQHEAAAALGLHRGHTMLLIILPQVLKKVLAPLASNSLELVKTTSIASMVALPELLRSARVAQEQTYNPTPLTAAAVIFFVMLWPFSHWVSRMERRAIIGSNQR
ncbi:amino acid ABC transporter permease [Neorhizobium sp. Rsf11]|uniref:Amino acid ABC transporter permease n=2 Tax=Neorhizobium TaxID=1525371 RepID=A0ABV0MCP0_9HYPH|nr:amino acid ABC transporter permease [Neorhizobium petrolearium]MCC2613682.1 amino acid ABC transporter permease [Neorhizobium petrolearium]WGI71997.1 amino acid ABC transporter permease [Neorhizobium petrolearium]